ncbi:MAG TPA: tetratricopeptide repeat protein [Thermoguttaceae bacterium]|nr:tetratricopeptide repeat protein [Thermoguttaceae bacterium]
MRRTVAWVALGILAGVLVAVYVRTRPNRANVPLVDAPTKPDARLLPDEARRDADTAGLTGRMAGSGQLVLPPPAPRKIHPLLNEADEAVLAEGSEEVRSTAAPELAEVIRAVLQAAGESDAPASLTIDYPLDETIFPPEIVPPTFLWHEPIEQADTWLIDVASAGESEHIYVLSPGNPPPAGPIDPECISEHNEIYQPTPYQASARSWTPSGGVWTAIKQGSVGRTSTVTILGFCSSEPAEAISRGRISITTSLDPVGAPIFYRDVPLAPELTQKGVIAPLGEYAVSLIGWRLRDISKPQSRLLLTNVPRCTNCHSFSADGKTLGMDLDGPQGDKGSYAIVPIAKETVIEEEDVISWNSFADKPKDHRTIGFLSRMSPDGQYTLTTLNEAVYVCNFLDHRFLQVFYPTRGILGYYSRATDEIRALPGADDPKYVHCDPVWTPDGEHLVFARAEAKDPYPEDGTLAERANDPTETQIQYDLYRMPFDGGRGGKPEPIAGASGNGMSNTFPKVSPDGKWIVFVKCRNGQLMRPDSTLWIVPAPGGPARRMRCNTRRMNSWHSFSPNGRWMVFSSKANTPYTQMFLTHVDENGNDSPAVLIPDSTVANRAVNLPEFVNVPYDGLESIRVPALEYLQHGIRGVELGKKGMLDEAMAEFEAAVKLRPDYWQGHLNAAVVLLDRRMLDEAMASLDKVLKTDPGRGRAHGSVGGVLARNGMLDEAMAHFQAALEIDPDEAEAHANMARLLVQKGMLDEAVSRLQTAIKLDPENARRYSELGTLLFQRGMLEPACEQFQKSLNIDPSHNDARLVFAKTLAARGDFAAAVAQLQQAMVADPNNPWRANDLAWLLAVCPQDDVRDGAKAVRLAERVCAVTRHRNPVLLSTLAAAYAETGKFPEAVATATRALDLVNPQDERLAQGIRQHLKLYRAGKPCRPLRNGPTD